MTAIDVQVVDGVGILTLDAPHRRNAFDLDMCDEVGEALDSLEADPGVGALVVTGRGSAFCAGADLSHLGASQREGLLAIYEGFLRVARCPLPTIAAVNGPAVGAGMNLALAADVRLAGTSARFDTRFLQLGIHPGGGHTWMFSVVVPIRMSNGRTWEMTANAGDWIVEIAPDTFQVWPADRFHAEWEAAR